MVELGLFLAVLAVAFMSFALWELHNLRRCNENLENFDCMSNVFSVINGN